MAVEHIRKWQIGDVEIVRIVEVNAHEDPFTMLSADITPEIALRHDWLVPNFATPEGRMKISFQAFVLRSGKDKRHDRHLHRQRPRARISDLHEHADVVSSRISRSPAIRARPITKVLCTHLHFDHVGWNTMKVDGKFVPTFPERALPVRQEGIRSLADAEADRRLSRLLRISWIRSIRSRKPASPISSNRRRRSPTR